MATTREAGRELRIKTPRVFLPLLRPSRYKGLYGGRGSGKSHAFADLLVERCLLVQPTRFVCIREYQKSLEQSCKRLLEDKIALYGLGCDPRDWPAPGRFRVMNTHIDTPGGGIITFHGMQSHNAESIKSLESFDGAWVEEAQVLSQRSLELLEPTIRKETCRYCRREGPLRRLAGVACASPSGHVLDPSELWFSWNPRSPRDPVDKLLRADPPPDAVVLRVNHQDNPFFTDVLRAKMEHTRDRDFGKYLNIWEGEYESRSERQVFRNWKVEAFETPADAMLLYGGDWGYSVDPSVLVRCYPVGRTLYIDHEAYQVGCEIDRLGALFDTVPGAREWPITADSARPETISYLQHHGFPKMRPAIKGANSVKEGVIFLQGFDIVVHPRCVRTIDELTYYSYKVDPQTEEVTPILEDSKNHVIDSLRYAVEKLRAVQEPTWVTW